MREFGVEALEEAGQTDQTRRRHAFFLLAMAEEAEPELTVMDHAWLDRLEREHDNFRTALRWTIDAEEIDVGLRMAGSLWRFWQMRGHLTEGRRWLDELLALPSASSRTPARAKALSGAGSVAYWMRDTASVRGFYEESLAVSREVGDRGGEAEGVYNLAFAHLLAGDSHAAGELLHRAAGMYRQWDDPVHVARANSGLAMVAYQEGDLEAADALIAEARVTFMRTGDLWGMALTSGQLAALALKEGDYERCRVASLESLEAHEKLGNTLGIAVAIQALAVLAVRLGRPDTGVRLAGAVNRMREVAGGGAPSAIVGLDDPREIARTGPLTEGQIAALWEDGLAMSLEETIALARRDA
jgi:tetratricopeptide (TPR) repeat protein